MIRLKFWEESAGEGAAQREESIGIPECLLEYRFVYVYEKDTKSREIPPESNRKKKFSVHTKEYFVFPSDWWEILIHGA